MYKVLISILLGCAITCNAQKLIGGGSVSSNPTFTTATISAINVNTLTGKNYTDSYIDFLNGGPAGGVKIHDGAGLGAGGVTVESANNALTVTTVGAAIDAGTGTVSLTGSGGVSLSSSSGVNVTTGVFSTKAVNKATTAVNTSTSPGINNEVMFVGTTGLTETLPSAVGILGRTYTYKLTVSGSCTIATTSSQTIDASTTYSLSAQYKYVTVTSDGANWKITGNN